MRKIIFEHITLACHCRTLEKWAMRIFQLHWMAWAFFTLFFSVHAETSPSPGKGFRLCRVENITSSIQPNMDASRYGLNRLLDGVLPKNGWRSTWTAWYQVDPVITFDLGRECRVGAIRLFFQAMARDDELKSVEVAVSKEGQDFHLFNEYGEIVTSVETGTWVELNLQSVRARYFQLKPHFQGWGHQWGEVEFWELQGK